MKLNVKPHPAVGDERIVEKFLLLPYYLAGERRWLEWVKILEVYEGTCEGWMPTKFV